MRITMKDIAEIAGVSLATVSFALNNQPGVSKKKRDDILKIAKEYGYSLECDKEKKTIRLVIFSREGYMILSQFFSAVIEGIERESRESGFELIVSYVTRNEEEFKIMLKQDTSAGWLVIATEMEPEDTERFLNIKKPIVFLDSYFKQLSLDYVLINNFAAVSQGVKHLIMNGHTQIGYLDCTFFTNNFKARKEAFEEVMKEHNLFVNNNFIFTLGPTTEDAYRDMKNLLQLKPELPTAFFAGNDILAFGAIKALEDSGIRIPIDVSIVGLDDYPFCQIINPRLTTIKVYKQEIGIIAIKRLVNKIYHNDLVKQKIEVDTELIVRDSVIKVKMV